MGLAQTLPLGQASAVRGTGPRRLHLPGRWPRQPASRSGRGLREGEEAGEEAGEEPEPPRA